jgi:para-nitrobenzyl esterase
VGGIGFNKMAEACLYLNVYAPNSAVPTSSTRATGLGLGLNVHARTVQTNSTNSASGNTPHTLRQQTDAASSSRPSPANANANLNPQTKMNSTLRPVLLWIHGGSFTFGGSTAYDGDAFFKYRQDVILVTCNYRLGALGWLGGSVVAKGTTDGSSGNFGLQDTRAALLWIKRNIGAFGGDPSRVTIAGESAGASMVEAHLVASKSAGLFHAAVMQSGAFDNYTVQSHANQAYDVFVSLTECKEKLPGLPTLECLRNLKMDGLEGGMMPALDNTSNAGWFSPNVDGVEMTQPPEVSAAEGKINPQVEAVLLGSNLNEGTVRVFRQKSTCEDAIGSHACLLEAKMCVTNGIPRESSLLLLVDTVNCLATLKEGT